MTDLHRFPLVLLAGVTLLGAASPAPDPEAPDPPRFSNPLQIDHPLFPFPAVGQAAARVMGNPSTGLYETGAFLHETRTFLWNEQTIETRVFEEVEVEGGEEVETSRNYFAQSDDGTVYFFGETLSFAQRDLTQEPSWLVGGPTLAGDPTDTYTVSEPAVFLPGTHLASAVWKSEDLPGIAEETNFVVATGVPIATSSEHFPNCVAIAGIAGDGHAHVKFYAPGEGQVYEWTREGWMELVAVREPAR